MKWPMVLKWWQLRSNKDEESEHWKEEWEVVGDCVIHVSFLLESLFCLSKQWVIKARKMGKKPTVTELEVVLVKDGWNQTQDLLRDI